MKTNGLPRIAVLTPHLTKYDAVCNDVFGMYEALKCRGFDTRIYALDWSVEDPELKTYSVSQIEDFLKSATDILIYHYSMGWLAGCELLLKLRCRKVIKYHNVTPPEFFTGWSDEYQAVCRAGRQQIGIITRSDCDVYLSDSDYNMSELISEEAPASKSFVVPPFNRIDHLFNTEPDFDVIDKYRDGKANLLMVGSLLPNKGHVSLLEAFAAYYHDCNDDSRLFIVGKDRAKLQRYSAFLRERAANLGLESSVIFTGEVSESELKSYYLMSDLFVIASEHEGFCVPLAESMAMKVPIIALGSSAIPGTVSKAGLVWEDCNPYLFAESIDTLISDESMRIRMSLLGRQRYDQLFTNNRIEQKLFQALHEVL